MIMGSKRDGRKIRVYVQCDKCGKRTQQVWIWDLALFLEGKTKRDYSSQNGKALRDLADCEDFRKEGKNHFCAACADGFEKAQLTLFGGAAC